MNWGFKRNYIEWDQTNNMWHDGHIHVYKDDKVVEHITCLNGGYDEDGNVDDGYTNPHDLIEELKTKWGLRELKEIKGTDWRLVGKGREDKLNEFEI